MDPDKLKASLMRSYQKLKQGQFNSTIQDKLNAALAPSAVAKPTPSAPSLDVDAADGGAMNLLGYYASLNEKRAKEQAALERQSAQRNRIAAVGDAVRHLGNIYNTAQGAYPQKLTMDYDKQRNSELARMQARWGMEDRALQNQFNANYKNANIRLKEKESEGRQAINQARAGLIGVQQENAKRKDEREQSYNEWRIKNGEKQQELREKEYKRREKADAERERHNKVSEGISATRASNSGGGSGGSRGSVYTMNYGNGQISSRKAMTAEGQKRMVEEYVRQNPGDKTVKGFLESSKTREKSFGKGGVTTKDITHNKNYTAAAVYILSKGDKDFYDRYLKMNGWTYTE